MLELLAWLRAASRQQICSPAALSAHNLIETGPFLPRRISAQPRLTYFIAWKVSPGEETCHAFCLLNLLNSRMNSCQNYLLHKRHCRRRPETNYHSITAAGPRQPMCRHCCIPVRSKEGDDRSSAMRANALWPCGQLKSRAASPNKDGDLKSASYSGQVARPSTCSRA